MKAPLWIAAVAACGEPAELALAVDQPQAAVELVPGGAVELRWTVTGGPGELAIGVDALGGGDEVVAIFDEPVAAGPGAFTWDGAALDGARVGIQVYDLHFALRDGGEVVDRAVRSVAVQGVVWLDPAPGDTRVLRAADLPAALRIYTVSHRELELTFTAGDTAWLLRTIPGEFVAFERPIPFDGTDRDGAPLAAGVYPVAVRVDDPDTALTYVAAGGALDWAP